MDRFFDWGLIWDSLPDILEGFKVNLEMMFVAEALTLVWGMVVVLVRTAPGPWGRPLRILGAIYVDVFRGIPLIVLFALIGFGVPRRCRRCAASRCSGWPSSRWAGLRGVRGRGLPGGHRVRPPQPAGGRSRSGSPTRSRCGS